MWRNVMRNLSIPLITRKEKLVNCIWGKQMIASRFNKIVKIQDRYFLYNLASKALFEVDETMEETLKNVSDIDEQTAKILYENGIIADSYEYETSRMINNFNNVKYDRTQMSIFLSMTASCNLNCSYCYQDARKELNVCNCYMNDNNWGKIIKYLKDSIQDNDIKKLTIFLFGGEPMLDPVKLQEYVKELKALNTRVILVLITNGTMFNEINVEFFAKNIDSIQITVDGPKRIHDKNRPYRSGEGTFDDIITNLKRLGEHNPNEITLRVNVDENSIESIYGFVDYVCEEGINKIVAAVKFSPIFATQNDVMGCGLAIDNEDFDSKLGDLYLYAASKGLNTFKDFDGGVCVGKVQGGYTIDENLNVYTCPGVLYQEACGKLTEEGIKIKSEKWFDLINNNSECVSKCMYAPICFGGCKWSGECSKKHLDTTFEKILKAYIISFYDLRKVAVNG